MTVKENVSDELPPLFVAVMVYVVAARVAVGVPVMRPVEVEKLSPAAKVDGLMEYDVGVPPVFEMEYKPLTALSTLAVPLDRDKLMEGACTRVAITMVRPTDVLGVVEG